MNFFVAVHYFNHPKTRLKLASLTDIAELNVFFHINPTLKNYAKKRNIRNWKVLFAKKNKESVCELFAKNAFS